MYQQNPRIDGDSANAETGGAASPATIESVDLEVKKKLDEPRWYPSKIRVDAYGEPGSTVTLDLLRSLSGGDNFDPQVFEIGVGEGATSANILRDLGGRGHLHLFDYEDNLQELAPRLEADGHVNFTCYGSSQRFLDSYVWPLGKLLSSRGEGWVDFAYLDGAHTWALDGFAVLLLERLLKPGGIVDFDDYPWKLRGSSLDPENVPETRLLYSEEQIDTAQVAMVVDTLIKPNPSWVEVIENRAYRKATPGSPTRPHLTEDGLVLWKREVENSQVYLEFGIGGSTVLAATLTGYRHIIGIDSDPKWVEAVRTSPNVANALSEGRAQLIFGDIGPVLNWGKPLAPNPSQFSSYCLDSLLSIDPEVLHKIDTVLIDGRFRVACAAAACALLPNLRRLLIDDWEREEYTVVKNFASVIDETGSATRRFAVLEPQHEVAVSDLWGIISEFRTATL